MMRRPAEPVIAYRIFRPTAPATVAVLISTGYFENTYLDEKADPYEDATVRGLLKWMPIDGLTVR